MSTDSRTQNGENVHQLPLHRRPPKSKVARPHVGAVVVRGRFPPAGSGQVHGDVIDMLEQLLSHARRGNIGGLVWAVSLPEEGLLPLDERIFADTVGEAAQDPHLGSTLACVLFKRAVKKAEAMRRGDPVEH